ncbi:uncharacterized protein YBL113C-like isoform X2 [Myripristis murdjan]|nr:uncharacterized protein YBL113C-like isoform X2 [Myripristis murdjan]
MESVVKEPFQEELRNRESPEFKALAKKVVSIFEFIFRKRFGEFFLRIIVLRFSPASPARARRQARTTVDTEAEVEAVFNRSASVQELPQASEVTEVVRQDVANTSITSQFNISLDASSITVTKDINTTANATTPAAPTPVANATTPVATNATTPVATNATTPVANATTPVATNATTAAATTPATTTEALIVKRLSFKTDETFTSDLLDTSSTAFTDRATLLKTQLEPFYKAAFTAFRFLTAQSFSNGSIVNNVALSFGGSAPNASAVGEVLVNAASNITAFKIDTSSITVDGTSVSSGVSHKISLLTASLLVVLSWILSNQQ